MEPIEIGKHLIIHPNVCFGKLTFKGTRLPVQTVLGYLALKGRTVDQIQKRWPHLKQAAIEAAIRFAAVAWPELLRPEAEETLVQLAVPLRKGRKKLRQPVEIGRHLVIDPGICFGKLTFKGTRLPVQTVLVFMTLLGYTYEDILESWPHLKREAIEEAIRLAAPAWPELLRPEAEKALLKMAAPLWNRQKARAKGTDEPTRSGRTA